VRIQRFAGAAAVIVTALLGSPALAGTMDHDTLVGKTTSLPNAKPATVEAWLEKLLGGKPMSLTFDVQGPNFNPGVEWDYAVVKYGETYAAYRDSYLPMGNVLNMGLLPKDVSNVRYFVLEPSALLLLGTGLAAAAPFVWSRRRRV
jgi:hypothetical protein